MRGLLIAACAMLTSGPRLATAGEPSPAAVAEFTRQVQPLVLNRCGAGTCHGGTGSGGFRLVHHDFTGRITREITLANIEAILDACGPDRSSAALIATISRRHPRSATTPHQQAQPLKPSERAMLERWLDASLASATFGTSASSSQRPPSRFQKLLDDAANPPPLPPPQEPKGILLKQ